MKSEISLGKAALIAGIAYLMVFVVSTFGNSLALENLLVMGDAKATTHNLFNNRGLFRFGISSWYVVIIFDIIAAWALFIFLAPVHNKLALLAAWFRLIFAAIYAMAFVELHSVLYLFSNALYPDAGMEASTMLVVNKYDSMVHLSFIFFGLHIGVLGYLILRSGYVPKLLGFMLMIALLGYLIDSFGNFLSPVYADNETLFIIFVAVPAILSEFSLTVWLLVKGRKLALQAV